MIDSTAFPPSMVFAGFAMAVALCLPFTCWTAIISTFSAGEYSVLPKVDHRVVILSCLIVSGAIFIVPDLFTKACEFVISLVSGYVFYAWGAVTVISLLVWGFSVIKYSLGTR